MARFVLPACVRAVPLLVPVLLAACGGGGGGSAKPLNQVAYTDPAGLTPPTITPGKAGNAEQEANTSLQVNKYLWRGALETLGFMPFASADPFGGVIVTDWYSPPTTQGERFKATAYVLGRQLRADGVHVTIFRQTRDGSQWTDAPASPNTATEIEGKILARARELRAQGVN